MRSHSVWEKFWIMASIWGLMEFILNSVFWDARAYFSNICQSIVFQDLTSCLKHVLQIKLTTRITIIAIQHIIKWHLIWGPKSETLGPFFWHMFFPAVFRKGVLIWTHFLRWERKNCIFKRENFVFFMH
jgi:hypothetical protein